MRSLLHKVAAAAVLSTLLSSAALADITIGVTVSSTGPGAALGIPLKNSVELWPKEIDGEKLNVIVLDDAGDPSIATTNARRRFPLRDPSAGRDLPAHAGALGAACNPGAGPGCCLRWFRRAQGRWHRQCRPPS